METQGYRNRREPEISDNALFDQAFAGDQEAFEVLVSRYQHPLFRLIYRYVDDYHEAHDVLQQVWLQLYLSLPTLDPHVHMKPWLFTVARNRSLDVLRHRRLLSFCDVETGNEEVFLDSIPDTSPTPEEMIENRDLQLAIWRAIQVLPLIYRSVVLLYYSEHMNYAEIGRVLKVPVSRVKARFHRSKPFLRAYLIVQ